MPSVERSCAEGGPERLASGLMSRGSSGPEPGMASTVGALSGRNTVSLSRRATSFSSLLPPPPFI